MMKLTNVQQNARDDKLALLRNINNIFIEHADAKNALNTIIGVIDRHQRCRKLGISAPAENICLTAEASSGKTTLCNYILGKYPRQRVVYEDREFDRIPTFYVILRDKTIKSLASAMLVQLKAENPYKGTKDELTHRLEVLLKNTETNLIILDEFHNLINDRNARDVLDWLKSLINRLNIPVLVVGTPGVESLIEASSEMSRRFKKISIAKLPFDPSAKNSPYGQYLKKYFETINQHFPFVCYPTEIHKLMLTKLYLATNGFPGNITLLVEKIGRMAIENDRNQVALEDLNLAFLEATNLANLAIQNVNPFGISDTEVKTLFYQLKSRGQSN